ncbi:MAG: rare lipoprotein A [Flavobacterium sp.]|jgi:rare lipoprotein A
MLFNLRGGRLLCFFLMQSASMLLVLRKKSVVSTKLVFVLSLVSLSACQTEGVYLAEIKPNTQGNKTFTRGNKSPYVVFGKTYTVLPDSLGYREIGIASWYGKKFHGRLTSNGEVYDMYQISAAHKSLPLPTEVKVTNLDNGKSIIVRVNDRGPFHDDRVIDLSYQTALALGFVDRGTAPVVVEAVDELNFPERAQKDANALDAYYLQVGAYTKLLRAEAQQEKILSLLATMPTKVEVNILQSEMASQVFHKVWLGPIETEMDRDALMLKVQQAKLGHALPFKVK